MNSTAAEPVQSPEPLSATLAKMAMGFMISQALTVAAKLEIADHLKQEAKSAEQLAGLTHTHAPSLFRLLRTLASVGVFQRDAENNFSNTSLSEYLRSDHPESLRGIIHMMGDAEHWNSHGNLLQSVKTGETAFDHTFGMPVFPYFSTNPEVAKVFDNAMTSFSSITSNAVAGSYDFSGSKVIADIGGGHGTLLSAVLKANPNAKGILFDQPQVVAGANILLENAGVADRTEIIGGDFFAEIPVKADTYLMKHIIHDWNDELSQQILQNCSDAMEKGAKLLLVESVVEEDDSPSMSKVGDLNMMVMTGGKERTAREYSELFKKVGLKLIGVHPIPAPVQIVEAVKI